MQLDAAAGTEFQSRLGEDVVHPERPGADAAAPAPVVQTNESAPELAVREELAALLVLQALESPQRELWLQVTIELRRALVALLRREPERRSQMQAAELRREAAEPLTDDATAPGYRLR